MDDDDLREELVALLRAREVERTAGEEALRQHERANDMLVELLRDMLNRLDRIEQQLAVPGQAVADADHST